MAAKTKGPTYAQTECCITLYYSITWYQFFGQMIHRPPNSECSAGVSGKLRLAG